MSRQSIRTQAAIRAALWATGLLVLSLFLITPLGALGLQRLSDLLLPPLDSANIVDLGTRIDGAFVPNGVGLILLSTPFWIALFGYFYVFFVRRAGRHERPYGGRESR